MFKQRKVNLSREESYKYLRDCNVNMNLFPCSRILGQVYISTVHCSALVAENYPVHEHYKNGVTLRRYNIASESCYLWFKLIQGFQKGSYVSLQIKEIWICQLSKLKVCKYSILSPQNFYSSFFSFSTVCAIFLRPELQKKLWALGLPAFRTLTQSSKETVILIFNICILI